jgi:dTDP-4-dehydrorhamnose 3,5-epimerase
MKITPTSLPEVLLVEPSVFGDRRGFFMETYHQKTYAAAGLSRVFVQDNLTRSVRGTLRGLHYQRPHDQAKLVQALAGEIFDAVVDIRRGSPRFGGWVGVRLSDREPRQLYIPEGFAHGFCVLSETALVSYKCSDFYAPDCEGGVLWFDPDLGIAWPVRDPILSDRDAGLVRLRDVPAGRLPEYAPGR